MLISCIRLQQQSAVCEKTHQKYDHVVANNSTLNHAVLCKILHKVIACMKNDTLLEEIQPSSLAAYLPDFRQASYVHDALKQSPW